MQNLQIAKKMLLEAGYDLTSPGQKEARKKYKENKLGNEQFVMVKEGFNEVKKHLSLEQSGVLMYLMAFVKLNEDGQLFMEHADKKKLERMTTTRAADLLGKSKRQTNDILAELEKLSLIVRTKEGRNVYVSLGDSFFNCGGYEEKDLFTKVYKTELKEIAKKITLSELGLLMQLLNHVHFQYHVLVDNPHETDPSKLQIWSRKHIANELGISIDFIKCAIPKLRRVQAIVEVKATKTAITLSPNLACKKAVKPTYDEVISAINGAGFSKGNFKK